MKKLDVIQEIEALRSALTRLYKASFNMLGEDKKLTQEEEEDRWGELNTACFEAGEALGQNRDV